MKIVGTTKISTLSESFGAGIAKSIAKATKGKSKRLLPDFDKLQIGDVILSSSLKKGGMIFPPIEVRQREEERFRDSDAALWTHAMLYVGRGHVAESTNWFKTDQGGLSTGIRIAPLVVTDDKTSLLICRRQSEPGDDWDEYRKAAASYALMDFAVNRRLYGFGRVMAIALKGGGKIRNFLASRIRPDFGKTIICSEYVLECLAIGGTAFTTDWFDLSSEKFFFPADFALHGGFAKMPVDFLELID